MADHTGIPARTQLGAACSTTQYNTCSVRATAKLASPTLPQGLRGQQYVQPVPRTMVAETKQHQLDQNFDSSGLVLSRSEDRNGDAGCSVLGLELADGSTDEAPGIVQTLSLTIFAADDQLITMLDFADKAIPDQVLCFFFSI